MQNLNFFQSQFGKMASTSYSAASDSGSSGEEGDNI